MPILIIGKSGSGKSASLRNFEDNEVGIINVLGKPLPFKNSLKTFTTDNYNMVKSALYKSATNTLVIDDAGYLITNTFMRDRNNAGAGNGVFAFYDSIANEFWGLIEFIKSLPEEKIVYLMMHEDKNDFGDIKPKTIGKVLDDKVCLEGLFTIVLRAVKESDNHLFLTKSRGMDVSKTPIGLFDAPEIDNDLAMVDRTIRDYYNLGGYTNDNSKTA